MITVLFLSCGRPKLTRKTIKSLITLNPEFKNFDWVAFENDASRTIEDYKNYTDSFHENTIDILLNEKYINYFIQSQSNIGIAAATSFLAKCAETQNNEYTLYLQNDWECIQSNWLEPCIETLELYPNRFIRLSTKIGQMYNTFTKKPFIYTNKYKINNFEFKVIKNGHFSMNPFLIRTENLCEIFPATKERHAQEKFNKTYLGRIDMSVESAPFKHIGDAEKRTPNWKR